jgi:hypothetical protein
MTSEIWSDPRLPHKYPAQRVDGRNPHHARHEDWQEVYYDDELGEIHRPAAVNNKPKDAYPRLAGNNRTSGHGNPLMSPLETQRKHSGKHSLKLKEMRSILTGVTNLKATMSPEDTWQQEWASNRQEQ